MWRAYLDQLQRSSDISAAMAETLNGALDDADELLMQSSTGASVADDLEELAEIFAGESSGRRGMSQIRYAELSSTLEGIAAQLR